MNRCDPADGCSAGRDLYSCEAQRAHLMSWNDSPCWRVKEEGGKGRKERACLPEMEPRGHAGCSRRSGEAQVVLMRRVSQQEVT